MEYEFVEKTEYQPVKEEIEIIIQRARDFLKRKYGFTFQNHLIGSGKRHLITRIKGGNTGFDLDYNLEITQKLIKELSPKTIKDKFMEAFNHAIQGTAYKFPNDSTSVITIKVVDKKNSRIKYGADFAIIYYPGDRNDGYMYLKNQKNGAYVFEKRKQSRNFEEKLNEILDCDEWNWVRAEYLTVKNSNKDPDKHSFVLFLEAVHNVYNQLQQELNNDE